MWHIRLLNKISHTQFRHKHCETCAQENARTPALARKRPPQARTHGITVLHSLAVCLPHVRHVAFQRFAVEVHELRHVAAGRVTPVAQPLQPEKSTRFAINARGCHAHTRLAYTGRCHRADDIRANTTMQKGQTRQSRSHERTCTGTRDSNSVDTGVSKPHLKWCGPVLNSVSLNELLTMATLCCNSRPYVLWSGKWPANR